MALPDEQADILGGPIIQRPETGFFATFSRFYFVFKTVVFLGLALLAWAVFVRGIEHIKRRRELASRKAMRRKHGIPDSDCRPFAVAYAAARRARVEREAQERNRTTNQVSDHLQPVIDHRTYTQKDAHGLRRRIPETTVPLRDQYIPAKRAVVYENKRSDLNPLNFAERYNPNPRPREVASDQPLVRKPTGRRASRKDLLLDARTREKSRKRSLADESDIDHETMKKSRRENHELIDGDGQADWYAQYTDFAPKRPDQEFPDRQVVGGYGEMDGQETFGHAHESHDEEHESVDEAMEGVDEDEDEEVTELTSVARGKKRDRAEAGSTFGGDDEEDVQNGKGMHHRKRRTISRRQSGLLMRGHKRDREFEPAESDGDGEASETSRSYTKRVSKKKKGKKAPSDEASEASAGDPRVSKDPLCGGRRTGDEWEADGIQHKVGEKGERLRLALIKKARSKFHMPQDSQHPDRAAALEIYVETWLTEEQYKQAEERQELAWQEAPKGSSGSKTPDVLESPTKPGKNLLWDSVKGSPARRLFRQAVPAGATARLNPFEQVQSQPNPGRRVASSSTVASPILPGITDSPTRPGFRGFSKWEKQDREAEAMARIRAKLEEQKKVQTPKPTELPKSATAPELGSKPISIPTITLTPPAPSAPSPGKSSDPTSQSKPTTSTFTFAPTPSTSEPSKTPVTSTTGFSLPSTSAPSATPTLFPSSSAGPTTTPAATPSSTFSFTKPPLIPPSASSATTTAPLTTASSTSIPNFFGKTGSGFTTQVQPSSIDGATKPSLSFGKPDTKSSTPAPAPSIFGPNPSAPATSPFIFTPTPTAAKAETPAPAPSSTAPPLETTKPSTPIFSFSAAPSSATAAPPTSSAPPAPKFSFGTPSAISSSFALPSTLTPNGAPQPKPTFKFDQTPTAPTDGTSASTPVVVDQSRMPEPSPSIFGSTAGSKDEVPKPSPFGGASSAFGSSTFTLSSTSATNIFGKVGADAPSSAPKSTFASDSTTTPSNIFSSTPAAASTSSFSFGAVNPGSNTTEGFKSSPLFGTGTEGSRPASVFGGSAGGSKPTFAFNAPLETSKPAAGPRGENPKPTEGLKSAFALGGSTGDSKPTSVFGGGAESSTSKSTFSFGAPAEAPTSTFSFGGAAESKPTPVFGSAGEGFKPTPFSGNGADTSKLSPFGGAGAAAQPSSAFPSAPFGTSSSPSPFAFAKKDDPTSSAAASKPASPFAFGPSSPSTGSVFGQPPTPSISGDQSQSMFSKPTNVTPSAFGFNVPSSSTSAFSFNKPTGQNQKQEQ